MIQPTVGRVVLYTPKTGEMTGDQCAAIVARVWSDSCVNLAVFDSNGKQHARTSVLLVQDENEKPGSGPYCEWMAYQLGQAAKTEEAESALKESSPSFVEGGL